MISYKIFIIPAFAIAAATVTACNTNQAEPPKNTNSIWDSIVKNVQTAKASEESPADAIKLNGKIQANEDHQAKIYALVSGKITSVTAALGDKVQKGQILAVLQSTEVANVSNDVSLAESNVAITKKNMESTKELYQGNLATERDYLSAQVEYNKALSELNRAKQVSAITGGKNAVFELKSPISGYVIEKNITSNSQVRQDNNSPLFSVADLSNVWIMANVYESDINHIQLGDAVKVTTLANPDKEYDGKIDKIYNVLDPATRTMKVRISMANPNNELKPEMFVTVKVNVKPTDKMVSIPSQSIVLDNSKYYVVVKQGNDLKIKEIQLIKRVDPKAYVRGLSAGDEVVTNSQVFIYQALNQQ
jgi:cobalt-zinc-cadmium efflux system membrane fusion protein